MKRASLIALVVAAAACGSSTPSSTAPATPETSGGEETGTEEASEATGEGAPAETATAPAPAGDAMATAFVAAHNKYRAKHCAPPLAWSPKLAKIAQTWANHLRDANCAFEHSGNQSVGENLAGGTVGALDPDATVAMWYDEVSKYDFKRGGFSMETGHFTQVVWTDTTQVGCGHAECKGMDLIVCNYDPPGNWEGQYREHVLPTSCRK